LARSFPMVSTVGQTVKPLVPTYWIASFHLSIEMRRTNTRRFPFSSRTSMKLAPGVLGQQVAALRVDGEHYAILPGQAVGKQLAGVAFVEQRDRVAAVLRVFATLYSSVIKGFGGLLLMKGIRRQAKSKNGCGPPSHLNFEGL